MRVHYIQHVPFEGLGFIETWLREHQHTITVTRTWAKNVFPSMADFDVLVILGGPMGVYDDHLYKWLSDEKNFIFDSIKEEKPIIGICLGAQLLACVLGATVYTNKVKEIGWFPVDFDAAFSEWLGAPVPGKLTVFHWHGDKFDNPYGGVMQASSSACNHQLFTFGDKMIGLQFHLEADVNSVSEMVKHGAAELIKDQYIQEADEISAFQSFDEPNQLMGRILDKLCTPAA
ncbi:MAG: gamma-glutamyl-gamma-aminobutyrate hydrolase family protein [Chitinophagaceae bacterium]